MYDEDEEFEEGNSDSGESEAFSKKGTEDRALVDQQAKDYDELKKRKRDELAALKQKRLSAQSKLAKKERELHALEIELRKSQYVDTRERVASERAHTSSDAPVTREEKAGEEVERLLKDNVQDQKEIQHAELEREVAELRAVVDESSRTISLLEHDILRT